MTIPENGSNDGSDTDHTSHENLSFNLHDNPSFNSHDNTPINSNDNSTIDTHDKSHTNPQYTPQQNTHQPSDSDPGKNETNNSTRMECQTTQSERRIGNGDENCQRDRNAATPSSEERESDIAALESEFADLESRIAELEAATQALRGYVGNIRSVNQSVERRADSALATVERLERQLLETGEMAATSLEADGGGEETTGPDNRMA